MSTVIRRDYVYKVFERQCEIGLANLARIHEVVGDRVSVIMVTGTDFGTQKGPFISTKAYRESVQAVSPGGERLDSHPHRVEDLHPFVRVGGRIDP